MAPRSEESLCPPHPVPGWVLTKSGRTLARTWFTKLSTRLGRSLRREEWGEERLTKLSTLGVPVQVLSEQQSP